jgi:hypothetical protein
MVEEARQSSIQAQGRSGDRAYMGRNELARYLAGAIADNGQEIPEPISQRKRMRFIVICWLLAIIVAPFRRSTFAM